MAGTLYVVATPLGNLDDLSPRAAATLRQVAAVVAEDTRHTKPLLAHAGARGALVSFHAHSSAAALRRILHLLGTGKDVALVTDAGTPAVSDPGAELVAAARARDVNVVTVPGPTAVAAALSVSGLAADRYLFLGFLPRKGGARPRAAGAGPDAPRRGGPAGGGDGDHSQYGVSARERPVRAKRSVRRLGGWAVSGVLAVSLTAYPPNRLTAHKLAPLTIGRLHYDGGGDWYAGPSARPNLLAAIRQRTALPVAERERVVTLTGPELWDGPYLYVTGHGTVRLWEEEVRILRRWLEQGGFLHADDDSGMDQSSRRG